MLAMSSGAQALIVARPLRSRGEAPKTDLSRKSLEKRKMGLGVLQVIEIPQNRQRNLWKSLEKKGLDLEKLGKKLGGREAALSGARSATPPARRSARAICRRSPSGRNRPPG